MNSNAPSCELGLHWWFVNDLATCPAVFETLPFFETLPLLTLYPNLFPVMRSRFASLSNVMLAMPHGESTDSMMLARLCVGAKTSVGSRACGLRMHRVEVPGAHGPPVHAEGHALTFANLTGEPARNVAVADREREPCCRRHERRRERVLCPVRDLGTKVVEPEDALVEIRLRHAAL